MGPDGATLTKTGGVVTGLVRTSKGYAVATIELDGEGRTTSVRLGHSQTQKEFAAREHLRVVTREALKA